MPAASVVDGLADAGTLVISRGSVLDSSIMFELFLRLKPKIEHEDTYNTLSRTFPGTRLSVWCNGHADIVEIQADGFASYDGVQKELEKQRKSNFHGKMVSKGKIISKSIYNDRFQLVARTCCCGTGSGGVALSPIFTKNNFMEVPPPVLLGGWEYHRLVGFDDNDLKGLLRAMDKIGETEVLQKKSIDGGVTDDAFLMSLNGLFGQLTEKQMRALLLAIENGYYEIPKRTTADELAKKQGQPRSTLEEHIRKAESKVLLAVAPYMMVYAKVPEPPFGNNTSAANETMGARVMKQLAIQVGSKI